MPGMAPTGRASIGPRTAPVRARILLRRKPRPNPASAGEAPAAERSEVVASRRVHATTRTLDDPGALGEVRGDVRLHGLEVTDRSQRPALRDALAGEAIDVLIHNAGICGPGMSAVAVNRINAETPFEVVEALMDAARRSGRKKIALVTSQLGARRGSRGSLGKYGDSKAALDSRGGIPPRYRGGSKGGSSDFTPRRRLPGYVPGSACERCVW